MSLHIEQMEWSLMSFPQNPHLRRLTTESNRGQRLLSSTPIRLLLKIPYRFNTGYQVSICHRVNGACDWFLSHGPSTEPAMNGTLGFQEVRSSISRSPSYRLLHEQQPQFGTESWHLLLTHNPIAPSTGISTQPEKILGTIFRFYDKAKYRLTAFRVCDTHQEI